MLVFAKTCLRDVERVGYQVQAVKARGWEHVVLVDRVDEHQHVLAHTHGEGVGSVYAVGQTMPEALEVEHPYMRQQVCKILAPRVWGDMLQIDSDMCPATSASFAESVLRDRWFFGTPGGARAGAVREWERAYESLTGLEPGARGLDFMGSMKGWWITRELVEDFLSVIGGVGALIAFANDAGRGKHKFSEYQMLGMHAYRYCALSEAWLAPYDFIDAQQPWWCHHFTSAEPLTSRQYNLLRETWGVR